MIPFRNRFHGHNSLGYVYKHGQAVRSHCATLKVAPNQRRHQSRIAVVVSKKIYKSAVKRNRIRRRVYEYARLNMPRLTGIFDITIIVSSQDLLTMPAPELQNELEQLFTDAHLYQPAKN